MEEHILNGCEVVKFEFTIANIHPRQSLQSCEKTGMV